MKVLILNGSPRNGNTRLALRAIAEGVSANMPGAEVETLDIPKLRVNPCLACDGCVRSGGTCVQKDDGAMFTEKVVDADVVIFGSPVYWWGVSAQLKAAIDRLYAKNGKLNDKKIGLVLVGEAELGSVQYELIYKQFECIAEYLEWQIAFNEPISANKPDDLSKRQDELDKLRGLWREL